jgi:arsenite/tail-anchored protein-transporting ATPase
VRDQVATGEWDLVIVDCAPTAETLRLLALPEALTWYMERVFPVERRVIKTLRPMLARAAGVPMPHDAVFDAVERLHRDLGQVRDLLTGPDASVRLVLTPESVVVAEARRALTTLSLYGYRVDGVVANRIFPAEGSDRWREQWVAAQRDVLADVERSFAPLPIWRSAYRAHEPVGDAELAAFGAELYGDDDPFAPVTGDEPLRVERTGDDVRMSLALPFADRPDVDLARHGRDLVVTVGSYRRVIALPALMQRCQVAGARLDDGWLRIRFRHDRDPADGDVAAAVTAGVERR